MTDDPLTVLVRFGAALRAAGLAVSVDRVTAAAEALRHWGVADGAEPYWPLRVALCGSKPDVPVFEAVYRQWFGQLPVDARPADPVLVAAQSRSPTGGTGTDESARDADGGGGGNTSLLASHDFEDMTEEELREVSAWIDLLRPVPLRRSMHRRQARSGAMDPGRTMRLMLRDGGELVRLRYRRPAPRPRRILLLVDISASMSPYSDMLLRFAAATLAGNPRTTEVFAVGTDHTRLTRSMAGLRPRDALLAAGRMRTGWSGGTTLGVALNGFLRRWGGTDVVRSAIVIFGSDGFEHSDPAPMIRQVQRLAALAKVLVWVDPDHREHGDRPVDVHIARAQRSAARVLGCHDYEALRGLAKVITDA
ncbi:hypothetical protein DMB66_06225 [Actinoplanes sp. ATCC 53533]|uniref:VWA domain-containing protein n=1 Tax=Actinoplanes sp. ATCC 53533 TaxID=1288362 RepID=UPI000F7A6418|nr:VWA domain-containing protein [Actinoplanes sp. ATCC 53533]RSM72192.1 hypothetical protein DMB66_06225 [Actinoplanes sp. ATCC 53533]